MASPNDPSPEEWWATSIIDMAPGQIRFRGYPIQDLIGNIGFVDMIWLMTRGNLPTKAQAALLEAALVAAVDHGPQAPSIAIARMAITCGVGINNAMASAINVLGDVHGGAGEQCVALLYDIQARIRSGQTALDDAVSSALADLQTANIKHVPGFGHRFHPTDPRAPRLLALVKEAAGRGEVSGRFAEIGLAIEARLTSRKGKTIPMNIDGATGVIFAELGFAHPLCRGLFVLSRAVGTLAHAWEEMQSGQRNKGPLPRSMLPAYSGDHHTDRRVAPKD
jgi:citrate synthase